MEEALLDFKNPSSSNQLLYLQSFSVPSYGAKLSFWHNHTKPISYSLEYSIDGKKHGKVFIQPLLTQLKDNHMILMVTIAGLLLQTLKLLKSRMGQILYKLFPKTYQDQIVQEFILITTITT